ncbi:TraB/GumN family protein, partial [Undibacterium sp.]|uniref:TraB/GumN family protein n=1 Tax=Undibacterium sp. TaxID=1914977 RepID=UPI00374CA7F1
MQFLLAAFLAIAGNAHAQGQKAETGGASHPLLWEVKGASNSVFLLGSIHVARPDFYPLPAYVEQAYAQADILAVEVDPSAADVAARMVPYLTYKAEDSLQQHITPATWQKLSAKMGPSLEQMKSLKPAMLSVVMAVGLYTQMGFNPDAGIDLHFLARAKADKKSVVELESIEFQAAVLGGLGDQDGESMLADVLDSFENGEAVAYVNDLAKAWKSGDEKGLVEQLSKEASKDPGSARVMKLLIQDRNPEMANKIGRLFRDGRKVFVVIGAGHLVGDGSV